MGDESVAEGEVDREPVGVVPFVSDAMVGEAVVEVAPAGEAVDEGAADVPTTESVPLRESELTGETVAEGEDETAAMKRAVHYGSKGIEYWKDALGEH